MVVAYAMSNYALSQDTLTYQQAFFFNNFLKQMPSISGWQDDDHYVLQNKEGNANRIEAINVKNGKSELVLDYNYYDKQLQMFKLENAQCVSEDRKTYIFNNENDLYYVKLDNLIKGKIVQKRLTWNNDKELNPQLSMDNNKVVFTRNNDIFVYYIDKGVEQRITYDGNDEIMNGYASWVYYEEIIGRSLNYRAFWISSDSRYIAFLRFDDSPVLKYILTDGESPNTQQYYEIQRYPVPGTKNPLVALVIFDCEENNLQIIDNNDNSDVYLAFPMFKPDEKKMFYQRLNRDQDSLEIMEYDLKTKKIRNILTDTRKDWVSFQNNINFLENGFIIKSDRSDWSHFYYFDYEGNLINKITDGDWNVSDIIRINTKNEIFLTGSKEQSTETHLYKVNLDGNNLKRLTSETGNHSIDISPNGKYFIDKYSNIEHPQIMNLLDGDGNFIRELGNARTEKLDSLKLAKLELFTIPVDGYQLPAIWYKPYDFDSTKKYPIIFSIYGGPEQKTVYNSYRIVRGKFREFWLAQNGIITIAVDNRGSGHFGRRGCAEMFRHIGKWELDDLASAVKWLKTLNFIDTTKIAITGGSYGGYVTALALTKGSEYFNYGIAAYSVTDWRLYDNVYTERYMDTPQENPDGYENASIMKYANKLKGKLFLIHGDMDDNVHCRHTYLLANSLILEGKEFDMKIYPNERHGFGFVKNRYLEADEVRFWFKYLLNRK